MRMMLAMARAVLIVLALLVCAAPAAAHDDWWPHSHHAPGKGKGKEKDKDKDKDKGSTTAPATTAVPGTITAPATTSAPAGAPVAPPAPAAPAPQLGATVALAAVAGKVTVRPPGGDAVDLTTAIALPTGTRIDTRAGEVALTSAVDADGATQTGRFSGGVFEVRQSKAAAGMTEIVLVGGHWADCKASRSRIRALAHAARKKARKPIRKLWGSDDHGRFQTRGGGSVATVRGTRWLTTDTCDGTRTTVLEGAVSVRSVRTGKKRLVTAGHTLFVKR
jgi:hypothetical protein